jgi:hypothetical protein
MTAMRRRARVRRVLGCMIPFPDRGSGKHAKASLT